MNNVFPIDLSGRNRPRLTALEMDILARHHVGIRDLEIMV